MLRNGMELLGGWKYGAGEGIRTRDISLGNTVVD